MIAIAIGCTLLSGCTRSPATITGKVTYNSLPLKGGSVTFVSSEGRASNSAQIGEDGSYTLSIAAGKFKVTVDTSSLKPPSNAMKGASGNKGVPFKPLDANTPIPEGYTPSNPAEAAIAKNAKRYVPIPDKYADPEKSELTFEVTGGDQVINLELK